jgi:hypothetical protein
MRGKYRPKICTWRCLAIDIDLRRTISDLSLLLISFYPHELTPAHEILQTRRPPKPQRSPLRIIIIRIHRISRISSRQRQNILRIRHSLPCHPVEIPIRNLPHRAVLILIRRTRCSPCPEGLGAVAAIDVGIVGDSIVGLELACVFVPEH